MLPRLGPPLAALLASSAVLAGSAPQGVPLAPQEFAAARDDIEQAIRKSPRYRALSPSERRELTGALDRMEKALAGVESVDELAPPDRTRLFNDQEIINDALTQAQRDARVVCERRKRVGSNFHTNTCLSVSERRRSKESAEQELMRLPRTFPAEAK